MALLGGGDSLEEAGHWVVTLTVHLVPAPPSLLLSHHEASSLALPHALAMSCLIKLGPRSNGAT
jgi:hypothetical protein